MRSALLAVLGLLSCGAPQAATLDVSAPSATVGPALAGATGRCGDACGPGTGCLAGECRAARQLHADGARGCAVVKGGVACWGAQIDRGGEILAMHAKPEMVLRAEDVFSVSVSERAGCALHATGRISCWVGGGPALEVPFIDHAVDITLREQGEFAIGGATILCAVLDSGAVECAELGRDAMELRPVAMPALAGVAAVASGSKHFCALHRSGRVSCWGDRTLKGFGTDVDADDDDDDDDESANQDVVVEVADLSDAIQIAASDESTCALRRGGRIACWGDEDRALRAVEGIDDAVQVATGDEHTCALRRSGAVTCWGSNMAGERGGIPKAIGGKVDVELPDPAVAVSAGEAFSCAQGASGAVRCWGSTSLGRLGTGVVMERMRPGLVAGVSGAKKLAVGDVTSCVLDANDDIVCWGVGPGAPNEGPMVRAHAKDARAIVAPDITGSICALTRSGDLQCSVPPGVASTEMTWAVGASLVHGFQLSRPSVAVQLSGKPLVWVASRDGSVQKTVIAGIGDAIDIADDGRSSCVVRKSGRVSCFQTSQTSKAIIDVPGVTDARSIVTSRNDFCVARATGDVACFDVPGGRAAGKPPPAARIETLTGVSGVVALASSRWNTCALTKSSEVWCWGMNRNGEAGLGDLAEHRTPTLVPGLSDVVALSLAKQHGCALSRRGEVYCWGKNSQGQVDPIRPVPHQPTPVLLP